MSDGSEALLLGKAIDVTADADALVVDDIAFGRHEREAFLHDPGTRITDSLEVGTIDDHEFRRAMIPSNEIALRQKRHLVDETPVSEVHI